MGCGLNVRGGCKDCWILNWWLVVSSLLHFKCKMLLAQVTDGNNYNGSNTLAEEWPPAEYFYKNLKDKIVEGKIKQEGKQVTEELYPSF